MFKKALFTLLLPLAAGGSFAQVTTPGTGVNWNLDSLAANFPAAVTQSGNNFTISQKITFSQGDTFSMHQSALVNFDPAATFVFQGAVVAINPDSSSVFAASDTGSGFARMSFNNTLNAEMNNVVLNYGSGVSILDGSARLNKVTFNNTYRLGNDPSGALSVLNGYVYVDSSTFNLSARSAITVGANGNGGVHVYNSTFYRNDVSNGNYPQINIGTANDSGIVVKNCYIEGFYTKAGAIAFLNIGSTPYNALIEGNIIKNNRYGIAVQGGNVNATILGNIIDSNNIEGQPNLGGSGLNFIGNNTINVVASGNTIAHNLWGVTVQPSSGQAPRVSLGKVNNTNPVDTGGNRFTANGNGGVNYAIYDNTPDTVWAQLNYWDYSDSDSVETTIFHHPDDSTLGWVIFNPIRMPDTTGGSDTTPIDTGTYIHPVNPAHQFAQIFPNPVTTAHPVLNIRSEEAIKEVIIYGIDGRVVYSEKISGKTELFIPLSQLNSGAYFIDIRSVQHRKVQKLIFE